MVSYADDLTLLDLVRIGEWSLVWAMKFYASKTSLLKVSHSRSVAPLPIGIYCGTLHDKQRLRAILECLLNLHLIDQRLLI